MKNLRKSSGGGVFLGFSRKKSRKANFAVFLIAILLLVAVFVPAVFAKNEKISASSSGTLCEATDFATLKNCFARATAAAGEIDILVLNDITFTSVLGLPSGGNIALNSGAGGPFTLTRDASFLTDMITEAVGGGTFEVSNLIFDGGSGGVGRCDIPAAGNVLSWGVAGTTVILNDGAVIQNNCRADISAPAGVYLNGAGTTLTMNGDATIQNMTYTKDVSSSGAGIIMTNGAELTMNGASSVKNNQTFGGGVGAGIAAYDSMINIRDNAEISGNSGDDGAGIFLYSSSILNMTGGKIANNTSSGNGGGVYLENGAVFAMSGGEMSDNSAILDSGAGMGGGIYSQAATVNLSGDALISRNSASNSGGGIYTTASTNVLTMTGGTISANVLTGGTGCGIRSAGGTVNLSGGIISDHQDTITRGGGLSISGTTAKLTNMTFANNSTASGSAIYLDGSSTLDVKDSTFAGNGNSTFFLGSQSGAVSVSDSRFEGNTSNQGAIYDDLRKTASTLTISDTIFANNSSGKNGGVVEFSAEGNSKLAIFGSTFTGNSSAQNGGAIGWVSTPNYANLTIDAKTIFANNSAATKHAILPADQPIYDANIFATNWSENSASGYNNFDIQYLDGASVSFDSCGGSEINSQIFTTNSVAIEPNPAPTKSGYIFRGWFSDLNFFEPFDFATKIPQDITLFANWEELCEYDQNIFATDENCAKPAEPTAPIIPSAPSSGFREKFARKNRGFAPIFPQVSQ